MSDDTKVNSPDSQDALWTEHEPDTERVSANGELVEFTPEAYVAPRVPDAPRATDTVEPDEDITSRLSPLGTAISHDAPDNQYIAVGPDPAKQPKRRRWLVGGMTAGITALLLGGAALAYNVWYQNPDKVLSDAVIHAVKAQSLTYAGSYATDLEGGKLTFDIDGNNPTPVDGQVNVHAALAMQGQTFKLNGSGIVATDGTLYFKLSNLRSLLDTAAKQYGMPTTMFDGIVAKIDSKWIKVSSSDVKQFNSVAADKQKCFTNVFKQLEASNDQQKEITNLYQKHKFITVSKRLGAREIARVQSLGYELTGNTASLKQFVAGLNTTKFAAQLKTCDTSFSFDANDVSMDSLTKNNVHTQVWVSRWSHDFTRFAVDATSENKQKSSFWLEPRFNTGKVITPPADAVTIEQLQSDIQSLWSSAEASTATRAEATKAQSDAQNVLKHAELYNAENSVYPTLAQLKAGTPSMPLTNDLSQRVGTAMPSNANPTAIKYELCAKATGAYISYFDPTTGSVARLTAGVCAA
jgi:hypothetical protein